jgi:N-acetylneuraminic acid mutarotase
MKRSTRSALYLLMLAAGCQKSAQCRNGTVFVDLTFDSQAQKAADHLRVEVAVGGKLLSDDSVAYAGQASYGLEIHFPGGYPQGQLATITVTTTQAGSALQAGSTSTTLTASCERLALAVNAAPSACSGGCLLAALEPSLAVGGATLTLEGSFDSSATVHFPGGVDAAAVLLGPHRATVAVPSDAGSGDLTVSSGGQTLGPLPFRRATFTPAVGRFGTEHDQAGGARPMANLATARTNHASVSVGGALYVIGGIQSGTSELGSVERATFHADGALATFTTLVGAGLTTPRARHSAVVIGSSVYVIGGAHAGSTRGDVERATLDASGALSAFTPVAGVTLTTPRAGHATALVGNFIYVIGGSDSAGHALASVERATLGGDGTLSTFVPLPDVTLATARQLAASVVIGDSLYVLGGFDTTGAGLGSVERASIAGDGTLGSFAALTGINLAAARGAFAGALFGGALYVAGGQSSAGAGLLDTVERAPINADGTLQSFATVASTTLVTARSGHSAAVVGNSLYVLGGSDGTTSLGGSEVATIAAGGTLSALTTATTTLSLPRAGHTLAVAGSALYAIGGYSATTPLGSVDKATIAADGSLSPFAPVAGVSLVTPRKLASSVVIGNQLYVIGGQDTSNAALGSLERATIGSDGTLSTFSTVAGVVLVAPRLGHTSVVIGSSLFVIGGTANASVERATIAGDGSLAAFATVAGVALTTVRGQASCALAGTTLYVLGGYGTSGPLASIEQATIHSDGSLGSFSIDTSSNLVEPLYRHASITVGDELYVFGGTNSGAVEHATISPRGSLATFTTLAGANLIRFDSSVVSAGNFVYVVGGNDTNPLATVFAAGIQ